MTQQETHGLQADEHGFGFFDPGSHVGIRRLGLRLTLNDRPASIRYGRIIRDNGALHMHGADGHGQLDVVTRVTPLTDTNGCVIEHRLRNRTAGHMLALRNIDTAQLVDGDGIRLGDGKAWDLRYCHTDNLRVEKYPHCQMELPYVRPLPAVPTTLGRGEDQPFPGLYLTLRDYERGLVVAAAGQARTFQSYTLQRAPAPGDSVFAAFAIHHELPLCRHWRLAPGDELELDGIYVQLLEQTHPEDAFEDYLAWLAARHTFRGPRSPLRNEAFYCSWNYGRFSDQYQENLLATADYMARALPNIKTFLVDAGYTRGCEGRWGGVANNFNDAFYPEPADAVNRERFPDGMHGFAEKLRALGLKPGIWWSPMCRLDTALFEDHPDWFLRTQAGELYTIGPDKGYLDLSIEPARQFMDRVLSVVLGDWGMQALKMDFWSQQFEDRDIRLAADNWTAIDSRTFLFDTIRRYLPDDGIFMTCVATGMGNPFLATHADTFRNTIDIGAGAWDEQIHTCYWALPVLGKAGRLTYLHNNDSAGINLDCPDNENLFRLTWCWITMGMQEIGGYLEKLPERYVKTLRTFSDRCDRGYRCRCPDEKAWRGEPLPEVLTVDTTADSPSRHDGIRKHVALFNWSNEPRMVGATARQLGLDGPIRARDFWTDNERRFDSAGIFELLPPRTSRLYAIGD